jgi:hypothetical protein
MNPTGISVAEFDFELSYTEVAVTLTSIPGEMLDGAV